MNLLKEDIMEAGGGLEMQNGQDSCGPPASMNPVSCDNYSKVVFTNIQRTYPLKTDIKCSFHKREIFKSGPKDWVGIVKVGWQTPKEYYTWVFASNASNSVDNDVLFKAYYLPKDDEFYQFCYVDHYGEVRGVSTPFQFAVAEDESEIVIVPTQDEVDKVNEENQKLKEINEDLTERKKTIEAQLHAATEKSNTLEMENMDLRTQVKMFEDEKEMSQKNILESDLLRNELKDLQRELNETHMDRERVVAENKQLQNENKAKQEAIENLNGLLENCKREVTIQNDKLEGIKSVLEMEKRQKEELQLSLEEQKRQFQDQESHLKKISTMHKNAEENISMLKQEMALHQEENARKNEKIKKLQSDIANLTENENQLKSKCKEYLEKIEDENKVNDHLEESLIGQGKKLFESENKVRELETDLRAAQKSLTSMKQMLAKEQNESWKNRELIETLRNTIELKEEEVTDLSLSCERKQAEVDDLNKKLLEAHYGPQALSSITSTSQAQGLVYGNPYEEIPSIISTENEAYGSSVTTVDDEEIPTSISKICPVCQEVFQDFEGQIYEDHVLCHTFED